MTRSPDTQDAFSQPRRRLAARVVRAIVAACAVFAALPAAIGQPAFPEKPATPQPVVERLARAI